MKKVTMFVWNHFTNDARVMREGLALSEKGYELDLIAIEDKKDDRAPAFEKINNKFSVHRVPMYPRLLEVYQNHKKPFLASLAGATLVVASGLFHQSWLLLSSYFIILAAGLTATKNRWLRKNIIKLLRGVNMTIKGYCLHADIYHSHDLNTLTQGVVCSKLRLKQRRLVYDSHEVQTDRTGYNPAVAAKVEGILLKFVDEVIVENHTRAKKHEALYGHYPHALYNYSELYEIGDRPCTGLHRKLGMPENDKILLYQGGIQPGRGLELLIEAMPMIEEGTLVFLGEGRLKARLEEMVKVRNLEDRIKFHPKVHLSELPSYTCNAYLGFQVLQNTSFNHYSASSNKLFEYIMAHVPIVSNDFPEIGKVVRGERVGIVTDASRPENIAEAVNRLVKDERLRDELSKNCRQAKMKYNWENEKEKLIEIYEAIQDA